MRHAQNAKPGKHLQKKPRAGLVPLPVSGPFDRVAVDIMGPLPQSENGNKYVIVFTEYLTRFVMARPLVSITARDVAECFMQTVVLEHGSPATLLSDQGANFLSALVKEICILCDTRKVNTTAYHPQTDGLVERFNKTLADMLSMYVNRKHTDWDKYLPFVVFAYNSSIQKTTRFSPFFLLYGREPRLPIDHALNFAPDNFQIDVDDYGIQVKQFLTKAWQSAKEVIQNEQVKQKERYDKRKFEILYKPGDLVLRIDPAVKKGQTPKLAHKWKGPYIVTQVRHPTYQIELQNSSKGTIPEWTHMNNIKPLKYSTVADPNLEPESAYHFIANYDPKLTSKSTCILQRPSKLSTRLKPDN